MSEPAHGETPQPTRGQLDRLGEIITPGSVLTSSHRLPGGLSCAMDVLAASPDGSDVQRFVLRRYQTDLPPGAASTIREARALQLALSAAVPVPEVVWIDREGIFDEPALVVSFLSGDPPPGSINSRRRSNGIAEALVRIHSVELGDPDHELFERLVPGHGDDGVTVPEELAAHTLGRPLLDRIRLLRRSLVDDDVCFVHGDFHPGNTLWRDDHLVGVVDWEIAAIGDPAFDVAYCAADIAYLGQDDRAHDFIDAYRRISGRALPNLEYWTAVALARAMPDIGSWVSAFETLDPDVTTDLLRRRHTLLVEDLLSR